MGTFQIFYTVGWGRITCSDRKTFQALDKYLMLADKLGQKIIFIFLSLNPFTIFSLQNSWDHSKSISIKTEELYLESKQWSLWKPQWCATATPPNNSAWWEDLFWLIFWRDRSLRTETSALLPVPSSPSLLQAHPWAQWYCSCRALCLVRKSHTLPLQWLFLTFCSELQRHPSPQGFPWKQMCKVFSRPSLHFQSSFPSVRLPWMVRVPLCLEWGAYFLLHVHPVISKVPACSRIWSENLIRFFDVSLTYFVYMP